MYMGEYYYCDCNQYTINTLINVCNYCFYSNYKRIIYLLLLGLNDTYKLSVGYYPKLGLYNV